MAKEHFIAGAIKHPGALHRDLGVPQGETIPREKLEAAAKRDDKTGQRARLAVTLGKMDHGRKRKGAKHEAQIARTKRAMMDAED